MSQLDTVSLWIDQLKTGDSLAAQRLWENYFQRMVELARRKLEGAKRSAADEEDVALSAFKSFCLGAKAGKFSQILDRSNLWPLLMAITVNKSVDLIRHENRRKRRAEPVAGLAPEAASLSAIISGEPSPELVAQLADEFTLLLSRLDNTGDEQLRQVAMLKLEGLTNPEIAERLSCARRTVERKLQVIQRLWGKEVQP